MTHMKSKSKLVVIGNGMAGARFLEELLALGGGEQYAITVFGDEPYGNYNRILLSGVLAGTHQPSGIFLNPLAWYADNGIRLHAGVRATAIDVKARTVTGDSGVVEAYDELVIATGSSAFIPPIEGVYRSPGQLREGVFVFRTLDDCGALLRESSQPRTAAVIGGGLLGIEAARGLLIRGHTVHVVHQMGHLMEMQMDEHGGRILKRTLEEMGLHIHLRKSTKAILGEKRVTGLRFEGGGTLPCDMVVISAGIRRNVELARSAGLKVESGIVVGDDLQVVGARGVYALGECVQHRGRTYGLVAPVWEQARVLAQRLSGRSPRAEYRGSNVATKLKVMGVELAVMGVREASEPTDEEVLYAEPRRGIYRKLVIRENRLVGAILLGDAAAAPRLLQCFDRKSELPQNRSEILHPAAAPAGPMSPLELPDDAQICNCNGVSKAQIIHAIGQGCRTLPSVCGTTRAGTGCGSCKKDVLLLLGSVTGGAAEDPSSHHYVPGVPLPKTELTREIQVRGLKSVSAVFAALADGREDAASKPALASLLRTIWGKEYEDERDARFINDRVHANIQKDGTFSVVPRIYGGITTPAELRRIADVAERYQVRMIKITGGQRIDLLGVPKEKLPRVWQDLGMPSGHAYTKAFRTCKTCVGSEFCRYGLGDSTGLGIAIERRFQGLESPAKLKLAAAGCPRNCSEATTKDVGVVAIEGGRWEIYIGGAAGSRVRKGDLLAVVSSQEEVLRLIGRFLQCYRENARYGERTYDFVERLGVDRLRRLLVDDADGIAKRLDTAMEEAVASYVDPWEEASLPAHPNQFASTLEPADYSGGA